MFSSLRSRLLFTYALVIVGVLFIVGVILLWILSRTPIRQAYQRVTTYASLVQEREILLARASPEQLQAAANRADKNYNARVILLSPERQVLVDSRGNSAAPPPALPRPPGPGQNPLSIQFRDSQGKWWIYAQRKLVNGDIVVVATPRPRLGVQQITTFRDDFLIPMLQAGALALILALLLAFWISRWVEAPLQHIAGAARDVSAGQYRPVPLEGPGEVQDVAKAFNEMTERVKTSQKSQKDFVANVSHDLKTPLTSIQGFAQAILDGTASTPEALRQSAEVIYSEASRMHRMVLDLLDLAKLDSGIADLVHAPVNLATLLSGVVAKLDPLARQNQVYLETRLEPLPVLSGDVDRLAQVFTNLIENAIKYTSSGGKVILRANPLDGMVEVSIRDNGPGIPTEDLPHVFERFYRADKSRKGGSGQGVGLGLAIAHEIITAHHGSINVYSTPGQGSTFVVKLPITKINRP